MGGTTGLCWRRYALRSRLSATARLAVEQPSVVSLPKEMRYVLCYQNLLLNCHQFGDFGSRDRPPLLVRRPAFEKISRPGPDAEDALSAKPASVREYGRAVDVYWATDADTL